MQTQVMEKNRVKIDIITKFEQAFKEREVESEKETIEILRVFEHEKKLAFRKFEKLQI
jgi:hypothetical protein